MSGCSPMGSGLDSRTIGWWSCVARRSSSTAVRFGLHKGDGLALLQWFLEITADPQKDRWMEEARAHVTGPAPVAI
jgi:hypothetical protein